MDREPSTTALSDYRARTVDLLKIVALAQLARIGFARAEVRGPSHACLAKPSKMGYNKTP
jgi:hypothetical protein